MLDLNELSKVALNTATKRMNNGANINTNTRSMLKHTATEVVEAMESYVYYKKANHGCREGDELGDTFRSFSSELADIICCVLIIAGKEQIDIEHVVLNCMEKNRKRAEGIGDKL